MGIFKNFTGVDNRITAGNPDFLDQVTDKIRDFACFLWSKYPRWITEGQDPIRSFQRGFMNNACANRVTLPSLPEPPFVGGQCAIQYAVEAHVIARDKVNPANTFPAIVRFASHPSGILGAITGITIVQIQNDEFLEVDIAYNGGVNIIRRKNPPDPRGFIVAGTIDFVVYPEDPADEICGNLDDEYPDVIPDQNDFITNINLPSEDGLDLNIPLVYAPIDFNFPLRFEVGDIVAILNLGGVDFNFNQTNRFGDLILNNDGNKPPNPPPPDDAYRRYIPRKLPKPNMDDFETADKPPEQSQDEEVSPDLEYVEIIVTEKPANARVQWGVTAPDVYYCGWFQWKVVDDGSGQSYYTVRQPIHFVNSIYKKPDWATGYAYTVYEGFKAIARTYVLKQIEE